MFDFLKKTEQTYTPSGVGDVGFSKISYKTNTWWYNKAKIDRWTKEKAGKRKEKERLFREMKGIRKKIAKFRRKGKMEKADLLEEDLHEIQKEYDRIKV